MDAAAAISTLAPDPRSRAVAGYWAARAGHRDLARLLLPSPLLGAEEDVRVAAALLLGEPVSPVGPISAEVAGIAWTATSFGCPRAFDPAPAPTPR